jgi:hypothetical protein
MWLFFSESFISVVADRDDPKKLLVRARVAGHIEALFPKAKVFQVEGSDYRHRALVSRRTVKQVVARRVEAIDYDNFKNSVSDWELHNSYLRIWGVMRELQNKLNVPPSYAGL